MAENKVKFGLRNVHVWPVTYDNLTNSITYGEARRLPGAVSLTLDPAGDAVEFKADDVTYYFNQNNQGYTGTLTVAMLPDWFREEFLGEVLDATDGVQFETSQSQSTPFAIAYEVQGDVKAQRFLYYSCNATRPSSTYETADTGEPQTDELAFNAGPRSTDFMIKAKTLPDSAKYATWFTTPWEPKVGV
ncbi:phage tail protein [Aerococcaceae bacterium DSM 111022]|nr:phage tail protein [Aerococcaceae bacterium DSM 111022]